MVKHSDEVVSEAIQRYGIDHAAHKLGMNRRSLQRRRRTIEREYETLITPPGEQAPARAARAEVEAPTDGYIFVGSDAHYWPGLVTTSHKAFVKLAKKLKPKIVVMNGDVIIGATISRHQPIGWETMPTVKEELDAARVRLDEIVKACPGARLYWPLGNHDARFETRLAAVAPEYAEVFGVHLKDHFPAWGPCWSVAVGGEKGLIIKHRFKGGIHATHNNTLWAGRTIVTGHLHSQKVTPFTDYNGTRWGVDTGCMAEPLNEQFTGYTEDNPLNWREGFAIFRYKSGALLQPQLVRVMKPGLVDYAGDTFTV